MCEGLARKMLGNQAHVESAGTNARDGSSANPHAIEVMSSRFGIDISSHRSRNVKSVRIEDFDYVVAMDDMVADDLRSMSSSVHARLVTWNIGDPIGRGVEAYERCASEIQKHLQEIVSKKRIDNNTAPRAHSPKRVSRKKKSFSLFFATRNRVSSIAIQVGRCPAQ
jgi:protein-tyrosine phosphatase